MHVIGSRIQSLRDNTADRVHHHVIITVGACFGRASKIKMAQANHQRENAPFYIIT